MIQSVIVDAALITMVLALAAFGLAIIFGLMGVVNLGHGAMLTLGAYISWAATQAGIPFALGVVVAGVSVGLIGLALEHLVIRHFYDRPDETLLLTWGFFLVSTEVIKIIFGTDFRNVTNPLPGAFEFMGMELPVYRTCVAFISLALLAVSAFVYYRSNLGLKIRALIQNREVASLLGLNIGVTYKLIFSFGAFMAGAAGALISPMLSLDPYIGNVFLVRSFFVVTIGGVGQLLGGTLVGSFLIGGSETIISLFSSQAFSQTVVFALAIVVLNFRPKGILKS